MNSQFPLGLAVGVLLLASCDKQESQKSESHFTIYAAASLANVLPALIDSYRIESPDSDVVPNFAATSLLAKQIESGAPAALFLSANREWIDYLRNKNLVSKVVPMVSNTLVVVSRDNRRLQSLSDLLEDGGKIALADWAHVPAGIYAKSCLEKAGMWERIQPRCIPALDVRAVLAYIDQGAADYGIVYRTDAAVSPHLQGWPVIPDSLQPDILYVAGSVAANESQASDKFLTFLVSEPARAVWQKHGFLLRHHG